MDRSTRAFRAPWQSLALVVAVMTSGSAWQSAGADPLIPAPTTGTATGTYRTGLTRAGLVSVESLGDPHLWIGRESIAGGAAARYDLRVELLNNGVPVALGLERCLTLGLLPTEVVVPWSEFDAPDVEVGDVLALRVSTRVGTNANDTACKSQGHFVRTEALLRLTAPRLALRRGDHA